MGWVGWGGVGNSVSLSAYAAAERYGSSISTSEFRNLLLMCCAGGGGWAGPPVCLPNSCGVPGEGSRGR